MAKKKRNNKKRERKALSKRRYDGAQSGRLAFSASSSSADAELHIGLRTLRDRSRHLVRNVVYAKRAKKIIVNNVVGKGVGLQGQVKRMRGEKLLVGVNNGIENAWREWALADNSHVGGALHFHDLERLLLGEVFEAGEVFVRLHKTRFGGSDVPLALEVIEAERIADDHEISPTMGGEVDLGIEHDEYGRPLVYYVHRWHPNEWHRRGRNNSILRIPADQILHLRIVERWPQTRGVPGLHAAITRLNQLGEYEHAALVAARIGASKVGFFEAQEWAVDEDMAEGEESDGTPSTKIEPGEFSQLPPGYKFTAFDPSYPVDGFDPFTRACLRGIAAGVDVSYESLSRDYSQSNYSSSRLALLDDRDLWRVLQAWYVRSFREPLHRLWLQQATLAGAIPELDLAQYIGDPARFAAARYKVRGWSWIDPQKEVKAFKEAERSGYITKSDVVEQTGNGADLEDVIATRRRELDMLAEAGLVTDTTQGAEQSDEQEAPAPGASNSPTNDDQVDDQGDSQGDDKRAARRGRVRPVWPKETTG